MTKETSTAGDLAERSVRSNGMDFDVDIGVRSAGQSLRQL
jgi:hypothetical protein